MNTLLIESPGMMTTVQDLGRPRARRFGVPVSGALDPMMLRLANAMVGNDTAAAGLEIRLTGPALTIEADKVRFAFTGDLSVKVTRADETVGIESWRSVTLARGDRLHVKAVKSGTFGYLAVAGGIDVPEVLDSRSTYVRSGFGGFQGRALRTGDRLPLSAKLKLPDADLASPSAPPIDRGPIRIVPGPQADHFSADVLASLEQESFVVGNESDRMGMRLKGKALVHKSARHAEIISDAVVPGAIQVPGNGQPIVLLADGQTVGGYPKIATVVSADLGRLANLAPGSKVRFTILTVAQAESAARAAEQALEQQIKSLSPVADGLDMAALYTGNLVGGVVDSIHPDHFPGCLEAE